MWRLHWRRAIFYSAITKRQHVSPCVVRLAHAHPHVRIRAICAHTYALAYCDALCVSPYERIVCGQYEGLRDDDDDGR